MEGFWNIWPEKQLTVQNLISYCKNMEYNHASHTDKGVLFSEVSWGSLRVPLKFFQSIQYFELRISGSDWLKLNNQLWFTGDQNH